MCLCADDCIKNVLVAVQCKENCYELICADGCIKCTGTRLPKSLSFYRRISKYKLDTETKGSTVFRNPRARL